MLCCAKLCQMCCAVPSHIMLCHCMSCWAAQHVCALNQMLPACRLGQRSFLNRSKYLSVLCMCKALQSGKLSEAPSQGVVCQQELRCHAWVYRALHWENSFKGLAQVLKGVHNFGSRNVRSCFSLMGCYNGRGWHRIIACPARHISLIKFSKVLMRTDGPLGLITATHWKPAPVPSSVWAQFSTCCISFAQDPCSYWRSISLQTPSLLDQKLKASLKTCVIGTCKLSRVADTSCVIGGGPHWNTKHDVISGQTCTPKKSG